MKTLQNGTKISDQCFSYLNVHLNIMHTVSKGLTTRMVVLNRVSFFELNNTEAYSMNARQFTNETIDTCRFLYDCWPNFFGPLEKGCSLEGQRA